MTRDLERGPRRPTERLVRAIRALGSQRKHIVCVTLVWIVYCTVAFGRGREWAPRAEESDALRMYENTLLDAERHSETAAVPYATPVMRTAGAYSLDEIDKMLKKVMEFHNWQCLAASHLGVHVQVGRVGETLLVNPTNVAKSVAMFMVDEESAFYPGSSTTRRRAQEISVTTSGAELMFEGVRAVCAQHLLDVFHGSSSV